MATYVLLQDDPAENLNKDIDTQAIELQVHPKVQDDAKALEIHEAPREARLTRHSNNSIWQIATVYEPDTLEDEYELAGPEHGYSNVTSASASVLSGSVNLANTILGTGMLAMPSAIASVGIIPGILLILLCGTASGCGLYFLTQAARHIPGRNASFFAVSQVTYPKAAIFFDLAIAIKCFGVAISYLIIISDLMPQVAHSLFFISLDSGSILVAGRFWLTIFMLLIVVPLSFLRKLDSLKYTSIIALFAVVYLIAIVIWNSIGPSTPTDTASEVNIARFSSKIFTSLPVLIFAFTCHQNMFTVYNELSDNSQPMVNKVIQASIGSAVCIYETIGILGYIAFGNAVRPNVIVEYPVSIFITVGRLAIVIMVLFSYPLQAHPCRASLDKVLSYRKHSVESATKVPTAPSQVKWFWTTTGILVFSYLIAMFGLELDIVLSFVGSTGSTIISFVLPGLFYYKLQENQPMTKSKAIAIGLACYGMIVMIVCLAFNIRRVVIKQ
ncbi:hypothetical protein BZG36_02388 [Bifiguratus adelaidae]|uniref:Amino acid transporter transmembrane domain-containing protein n=1 Tax=Bifiguratus adelaidae TaxID=1938954 RepID=A0A261Y152_9FUNG|nr:hypothetical protein BZG36_02388 [Bifiguratus adelaidae]